MITITIPGEVRGKGRPQFSRASGAAYTPTATRTREGIIASLAMDAMQGRAPLSGPVEMRLEAVLDIPKSWTKKRREAALAGAEMPAKKPDLDNIAKLVWDALNGIVYADDCQIVAMTASKRYGETARTIVTVRAAE